MILTDLSDEILIDERITDRSPAIYFITHLYCNEAISFPKNWDQLEECHVYTTEYIAKTLYAYLGDKDKFRILDTVKPMTIVLSNYSHFKVTTFIGKGVNKNCALLFECEYFPSSVKQQVKLDPLSFLFYSSSNQRKTIILNIERKFYINSCF